MLPVNPAPSSPWMAVISDTHGLLRPELMPLLEGCDGILHAGDVGGGAVLKALQAVAPVHAVRGNMDAGVWAADLPWFDVVVWQGKQIGILHDVHGLDVDPVAASLAAVIHGHTHLPTRETHRGVLYLNPGSIGPRRAGRPVSMARMWLEGDRLSAEIVTLEA